MIDKLTQQQNALYQLKNGLMKHQRRNMKTTQAFERAVKILQKHVGNTITESNQALAEKHIEKCIGELLKLVLMSSVTYVANFSDNLNSTAKTEAMINDLLSAYTLPNMLDALMVVSSGRIAILGKAYYFSASSGNVVVTIVDDTAHLEIENEQNIKPIVVKKSSDFGKTLLQIKSAITQISQNATDFYQGKAKALIKQHGLTKEDVALLKRYA